MNRLTALLVFLTSLLSCRDPKIPDDAGAFAEATVDSTTTLISQFRNHSEFIAHGFDFPVGPPDAGGYYNAQAFRVNDHLGDDWNGTGGGNSDLGDPVFAVSNGYVVSSVNLFAAWSRVVRMVHCMDTTDGGRFVESVYAHLDTMFVRKGDWVKKGQQVGTIGNSGGIYYAHLHLEIRDSIGMETGGGYSTDTRGYLDPSQFIRAHRK